MKMKKKNASHYERQALVRRILDAGVPVHTEEDLLEPREAPEPGLYVYPDGAKSDSYAFDFYGGTGIVIRSKLL